MTIPRFADVDIFDAQDAGVAELVDADGTRHAEPQEATDIQYRPL